jgi:hypothetical protein
VQKSTVVAGAVNLVDHEQNLAAFAHYADVGVQLLETVCFWIHPAGDVVGVFWRRDMEFVLYQLHKRYAEGFF